MTERYPVTGKCDSEKECLELLDNVIRDGVPYVITTKEYKGGEIGYFGWRTDNWKPSKKEYGVLSYGSIAGTMGRNPNA